MTEPNAAYSMEMFQKLYAVDRKAKEDNLTVQQRHALRLDEALPMLNELGKFNRRTSKDYERQIESSVAFIHLSMIPVID